MAVLQRFLAITFLVATFAVPAWSNDHVNAETIVARVGKTDITLGHMIAMVQSLPEQQLQSPPGEIFDQILERIIRQEVVAQRQTELSPLTELQLANERRSLLASREIEIFG